MIIKIKKKPAHLNATLLLNEFSFILPVGFAMTIVYTMKPAHHQPVLFLIGLYNHHFC